MNFDRMFKIVKELDFDKKEVVCEENNIGELCSFRTKFVVSYVE